MEERAMSRRIPIAVAAILSLTMLAGSATASAAPQMFITQLSGDEEVPARDTQARGIAIFQLSSDGTQLSYRLVATKIDNVFASHIHVGAAGVNGPVVAFLFEGSPASGRHNGLLAMGTITEDDLIGPLLDQPFSSLINAITTGNAYVNVHTNDGVGDPNSGPGDFPGGEIRGQLD
jgi:hypothetical protein